ncbi:MAG: CoA transferase [Hyphomicrobiales bacterium]
MSTGPLAGIRVLEFSQIVAGPVAGIYLSDFGADVVKVEPLPYAPYNPTSRLSYAYFNA